MKNRITTNKIFYRVALFSIFFFFGSCTQNYFSSPNNTLTQENLDSALFGHWRNLTKERNYVLTSDGKITLYLESTLNDGVISNEVLMGDWYTVGDILSIEFSEAPATVNLYYVVGEYAVTGDTLSILKSSFESALDTGKYSKQ